MMSKKGCSQLTSSDTYFSESLFSGVKMVEEEMAEGIDCCGLVNTSHKGFCLSTLEKLTKEWPGGTYLVMKSIPRVPGDRPLTAIGYKYNSRKFLRFISTEGSGSTEPGNFADSLLSGLKMVEEEMAEGINCCGLVNTSHKGFCLSTL